MMAENRCILCGAVIPEGRLVCPECQRIKPQDETPKTEGENDMDEFLEWAKAAGVRAVRTFAEAMLAYIGTGALMLNDVNWVAALSAGAFGAVSAILLALTGLPEVRRKEE